MARDEVRLLVADGDRVRHAHFRDLADHLDAGRPGRGQHVADGGRRGRRAPVGARPAHARGRGARGDGPARRQLGRRGPHRARRVARRARCRARPGADGCWRGDAAVLTLLGPYPSAGSSPTGKGNRLWRAVHAGDQPLRDVLARVGRPIAYGYLDRRYDLADYQTIFGTTPGSAEMPSAARPFTPGGGDPPGLAWRGHRAGPAAHRGLVAGGRRGAQPEWFEVGASTARLVNSTRAGGGRVVAVGTTVTRALESAVTPSRAGGREPRLDRPRRHPRAPAASGGAGSSPAGTTRRRPICCWWSR